MFIRYGANDRKQTRRSDASLEEICQDWTPFGRQSTWSRSSECGTRGEIYYLRLTCVTLLLKNAKLLRTIC